MALITSLENLLFSGGLFGNNFIWVGCILVGILLLMFALRLPIWFSLILILPVMVIGGGNLISAFIQPYIKLLVVVGIFAILGLTYMTLTSGNK